MMEKLGHPQTHLALKEMIKEIDEDFDGKINFKEVFIEISLLFAIKISLKVSFESTDDRCIEFMNYYAIYVCLYYFQSF